MASTAEAELRSATPIRVFLIDEEVVVRAGLRILIDSWPISTVIAEADRINQAMAAMEAVKPDLVVFSHNGRTTESLEGLDTLVQAAGRVPLVLLTSSRDPRVGAFAVQSGAKWIILKQYAAIELRMAIEKAHSGEVWPNEPPIRSRVAQRHREEHRVPRHNDVSLTNREREVAVLVSRGCTNRQAGRNLGITEITVRHHLTSIFNKLGVANRFELISWLFRQGFEGTEAGLEPGSVKQSHPEVWR